MEYVYAALVLHEAGKEVDEENVTAVLEAANVTVERSRVAALVAALEDVDIAEAVQGAGAPAAPAAAAPAAEESASEEAGTPNRRPKTRRRRKRRPTTKRNPAARGWATCSGSGPLRRRRRRSVPRHPGNSLLPAGTTPLLVGVLAPTAGAEPGDTATVIYRCM
jgi:large subunit ribosomal protein L12